MTVTRGQGSQPGSGILPDVVTVLAEAGIDVEEEFPKPLTAHARAADR